MQSVKGMQPLKYGQTDLVYRKGFFAFLCGAVLMGVLLGTIAYCCSNADFLYKLSLTQSDFIKSRAEMDHSQILTGSLTGTTIFLAAAFLCGLCPLGQPAELALLVFRGMGIGLTLSQLYGTYGRSSVPYAMGLILPGAVISTLAVVIAVREAMSLSGVYLGISLSDRAENGLAETVKLYGTKFMVLEAALAAAAGADCLCSYLFIGHFG